MSNSAHNPSVINFPQTRVVNKSNILYFFFFTVVLTLFFAIKCQGPVITQNLYQNQNFTLLNKIILINGQCQLQSYFERSLNSVRRYHYPLSYRRDENPWNPWETNRILNQKKSLDYYQGEIENTLWGPLKSLLSGILLLTFCLRYLTRTSVWQFAGAIFIYLIITRPEVLLNPPFGEGITGPFSDAIWLYQHSLDYPGLLRQETLMTGGPQIYPTALYPLFLATLMKVIPSTKVFLIVMHVLTFFMTATVVALLKFFTEKIMNERLAVLTAVLLVAFPIFQSMLELINLEMPSLFFAMLSIYYLYRNNFFAASAWALASIFTKDPGVVTCLAVLGVAFIHLWNRDLKFKDRFRILIWPTVMIAIAAVKTLIRTKLLGEQKDFCRNGFLLGWHNLNYLVWFYIFVVCLIIIFIKYILYCRAQKKNFLRNIFPAINKHFAGFLMFLIAGMWYVVFNNFLTLAYRYELLLLPFQVFCMSYTLYILLNKRERVTELFLIGFIMFGFAASYGLVFWDKTESFPTNLERSLEYRNYLKLETRLAKEIEQNFSGLSIVAPFQTAQALAIPRLGYVDKQLDVTVYGMGATLGIKQFNGIDHLSLLKTVWVGFPHHYSAQIPMPYPIDPQDKILKKLETGHIEVDIFMGGFAVERMWRIVLLQHQRYQNAVKKSSNAH